MSDIRTLWIVAVLACAVIVPSARPLQGDIWWVLKSGELVATTGYRLEQHPFSFAPQIPYSPNIQWLGQLMYYYVYSRLGLEGVVFFTSLLSLSTFSLLLYLAWTRSRQIKIACACTFLGTLAASTNISARTQTVAFLLFMLSYVVLSVPSPRIWMLGPLAALQATWANMHGSFFLGPLLTVVLMAGLAVASRSSNETVFDARRRGFLAAALLVQVLASLATPYGLQVFSYVLSVAQNRAIRTYVSEWQPPTLHDLTGAAFYLSLAAIFVAVAYSNRRIATPDLAILACFALLALQAERNVAWWALASTPVMAAYLSHVQSWALFATTESVKPRWRGALNLALAGLVSAAVALSLPWSKASNPLLPVPLRPLVSPEMPEPAAAVLRSRSEGGRILAYQGWGGYLVWALWPRYLVMLDDRLEIYPETVVLDYFRITNGHAEWQQLLDSYSVTVLVLHNERQASLRAVVQASSLWQLLHQDRLSSVFIRVIPNGWTS